MKRKPNPEMPGEKKVLDKRKVYPRIFELPQKVLTHAQKEYQNAKRERKQNKYLKQGLRKLAK